MATISTVPTVKAQLVTKFTTALATSSLTAGQVQVAWAWPGPETESESVFLGFHPGLRDVRLEVRHEIPTIKAGRKQRQERYTVPVTVWSFVPSLTAKDARTAEERVFTLVGKLEDEFANDPTLGLASPTIISAAISSIESTLHPINSGWGAELVMSIDIAARLT